MKRKLLSIILLVAMLCMGACGGQTDDIIDTEINAGDDVAISLEGTEDHSLKVDPPYSVEVEIPADMEAMLAPMDAILMCGAETGFEYDSENPEVFWRLMYYNIGNHGSTHPLAKVDRGILELDRKVVQEFATGMFANYSDLPELPEEMEGAITYDESIDAYLFSLGDRGLSQAEMVTCMKNADGSYDVTARLYDMEDNSTIVSAVFHLVANPYADGIMNPMFLYTISSVVEFTE